MIVALGQPHLMRTARSNRQVIGYSCLLGIKRSSAEARSPGRKLQLDVHCGSSYPAYVAPAPAAELGYMSRLLLAPSSCDRCLLLPLGLLLDFLSFELLATVYSSAATTHMSAVVVHPEHRCGAIGHEMGRRVRNAPALHQMVDIPWPS